MKKIFGLFAIMFSLTACGYDVVEPGTVGIVVNMVGSDRGVDDMPLRTGRVFYNPVTENLYKFPTTLQTTTWALEEGGDNQELVFNAKDGAKIRADVSIGYSIQAELVPDIFEKHKKPIDAISNTYVKTKVRGALNAAAESYTTMEIYATRRQEFLSKVREIINADLTKEGFTFEYVEIVGSPRLDPNFQAAIEASLKATQDAQRVENELRATEAEAKKTVAQAEGAARSTIVRAEAEAEANRLRQQSLTPLLIQQQLIEKWNGEYPQIVSGNSQMLMQLPAQR